MSTINVDELQGKSTTTVKIDGNLSTPKVHIVNSNSTIKDTSASPGFAGQILYKKDNDEVQWNYEVPIGGIIMWYGTADRRPIGWEICDGTNGTPNLSERFVMQQTADLTYSIGMSGNDSSSIGAHTHTFTESNPVPGDPTTLNRGHDHLFIADNTIDDPKKKTGILTYGALAATYDIWHNTYKPNPEYLRYDPKFDPIPTTHQTIPGYGTGQHEMWLFSTSTEQTNISLNDSPSAKLKSDYYPPFCALYYIMHTN